MWQMLWCCQTGVLVIHSHQANLGDTVSEGRGFKCGKTARARSTWEHFNITLNQSLYPHHGKNFDVCVRSAFVWKGVPDIEKEG